MRTFRSAIFLVVIALCTFPAFSQDKIYLGIGTQSGKVTDINADVIKYTNAKGVPAQASVKDVFVLFNAKGGYLVPYRMDFSNAQTKNIITAFINPPSAPRQTDYIYTLDGKLIKGAVVKESKKTFTINENGNQSELDAKRVVAIVYKDGHHTLVSPVITVADILWTVYEEEAKNESKNKPAPLNTADVKTEPAKADPVPVKQVATETAKKVEPAPVTQQKIDTPKKQVVVADNVAQTPPGPAPVKSVKFEDVAVNINKEDYEKKALDKTRQLNNYLKVLCNKTAEYEERNKAVDLAVGLFISENSVVQTSSLNSNELSTYKIKAYLKKIKLENYDKVEIEWTKLQYVSNLKKAPDGNYYGTISFEQVFRGYRDGKIAYEDITVKTGEVILKAYEKMINGETHEQWDVMLGDISVKTTKSL